MTSTKYIIALIFLLLAGCSEAEKGYQKHGWAKVVSGTNGRMSFQFYQPATLTQREIDSLNSLPVERPSKINVDSIGGVWLVVSDSQDVYSDTLTVPIDLLDSFKVNGEKLRIKIK